MSRVDLALRRASGSLPHPDSASGDEAQERSEEGLLHRYPREAGSSDDGPGLLAHRTIAAPPTGERRQLGPLHPAFERKLVVSQDAWPLAVEQYRRLAGTLHELQVERGLKTLMVTSALPREGKTLTVVNVALTLSAACKRRVLLIDGDLRRPSIHELFRLPNACGLNDVLRAARSEIPLLQQVSDHLSVLPAGRPDQPMAGLTSDRMRMLLEQSSATFDWVLVDAAPVGFIPDAALLARLTRAVLFVIASHGTPYSLVSRAIAALDPECIVGTVLNRVAERDIPAADYYRDY